MWKAFEQIGMFLSHFFKGLIFAAYDYDVQLRRTKTPRDRLIIWIFVILITGVVIYGFLWTLGDWLRPFINRTSQ
jgi:hypothetical protein